MTELIKLSAIEQYNIDKRIADARSEAGLKDGNTILMVIGGVSDDWQEAYAQVTEETRVVDPAALAASGNDPGPRAGT